MVTDGRDEGFGTVFDKVESRLKRGIKILDYEKRNHYRSKAA